MPDLSMREKEHQRQAGIMPPSSRAVRRFQVLSQSAVAMAWRAEGGVAAHTLIQREADYGAPVCSHFGQNIFAHAHGKAYAASRMVVVYFVIRRKSSILTNWTRV